MDATVQACNDQAAQSSDSLSQRLRQMAEGMDRSREGYRLIMVAADEIASLTAKVAKLDGELNRATSDIRDLKLCLTAAENAIPYRVREELHEVRKLISKAPQGVPGVAKALAHLDVILNRRPPTAEALAKIDSDTGPFPFWVRFSKGAAGCVEAVDSAAAERLAARLTGLQVTKAEPLPHPARPRINSYRQPEGGYAPSLCHKPNECAGKTWCQRQPSCTE